MGRKIEGGIKEHQDLARFTASSASVAAKDQIDLMARNWFSLTPGRTEPIEHEYVAAKTGRTETIRITGSAEHGGIATIYDQDLLIFVMSQWIDAKSLGIEATRRIHFMPYQFFSWLNIEPHGSAYQRLKEALRRLKTTNIQTTIRSEVGSRRRNRIKQFSWISEWEITEELGEVRGVEVVLAEWLFESIQDFHVLTLDKLYFEIPGGVERWLYLHARRAAGGPGGTWKESYKSLYQKSAALQEFKHFASSLRKLVKKNELPGFNLRHESSARGNAMLVMERTDKREVQSNKLSPPLELIERTPLEEAWENVLEILRRQIGEATANSWLKPLHIISFENATLTCRAPTKFVGDWVESRYLSQLREAWKSVGYEVTAVRVETAKAKPALETGTTRHAS
jgi:plasmid replication initiation protein